MILTLIVLLAGRLVQIQGFEAEEYAAAAADMRLRTIDVPTLRGQITDADGNPFALSVEVRTVFVDPQEVEEDERDELVAELAGRIPHAGERFRLDGLEIDVLAASPARVERLLVRAAPVATTPLGVEE